MAKIYLKKSKNTGCKNCFYYNRKDCPEDSEEYLVCVKENINFIQVPKPEEK